MEHEDNWHVLIIEDEAGHRPQTLTEAIRIGPDREAAMAEAVRMAERYRPDHPNFPRARRIFQTSPQSWVVNVKGLMSSTRFFTVLVANLIYDEIE